MEPVSTMSAIMTAITTLVTNTVTWAGSYLTMISGNDILVLFCIALPLVGLGIGVIKRLVRIRA